MNKIKYALTIAVILIASLIIYSAEDIGNGVRNGIEICINSVIPSLFIFSVISIFIVKAEIFSKNKLIDFLTFITFGFRGEMGAICLLSVLGGYPVGSALVNELYCKGTINKRTANIMLNFCINPGPAFIIGMVGIGIYNSTAIGYIILFASLISTIICSRLNLRKISSSIKLTDSAPTKYVETFINSVKISVKNMAVICGWVVLATSVSEVLSKLNAPQIIGSFLEVTSGVVSVARTTSIYFVAFLIGFGGIAVHLQAISSANAISPKYSNIFRWKVLQGLLTSGLTYLLLKIFPQSISVSKNNVEAYMSSVDGNLFNAIVTILFIMSTLIFINENVNKGRKIKKYVIQ